MPSKISVLQQARAAYQPKLPSALKSANVRLVTGEASAPATDQEQIRSLFPSTYGQPVVSFEEGSGGLSVAPLKVGVVLSGGQAPGGHNVIVGLFDALQSANRESRLYGFLKGPGGVIKGDYRELTSADMDRYRNTGGFDMIMSGRDKIEKPEELAACARNLDEMGLDGLVVIGGDDSNTNAAVLAEYLKAAGSKTVVVGAPKTIDGDMKNEQIEISFGFDTASRVYSELIGNIARDASSAVKYWHFIRLMGRAASHVTLECALQTRPNIALISEEVKANGTTLEQIVDHIVDVVIRRAAEGKHYGVVLVPEGLVEFVDDIRALIDELSAVLGKEEKELAGLRRHAERVEFVKQRLTPASARVYGTLPPDIQFVLLQRDSHGNVPLSQVETERLLVDLVTAKIQERKSRGEADPEFSPLTHFFGYEGRCAAPSNFDADYTYSLGYTAAQLIRAGLTGYTANVQRLTRPSTEWIAGGTPVTMMLNIESRRGRPTPVIKKALTDLEGRPFRYFTEHREAWATGDEYVFPGPIQYFGPTEVCDAPTMTLMLEQE